MRNLRRDSRGTAVERGRWLAQRVGQELRIARVSAGLSQSQVARRAGVNQTVVSRTERGVKGSTLLLLSRLAQASGHEVSVRLFPAMSIRLRDSGQAMIAQELSAAAAPSWRVQLEVPVAPNDPRAADMVLSGPTGVLHLEIERALVDLQAQLRAAQLKREALTALTGRSVRLVLVLADTRRNRLAIEPVQELLARTMPARAREIWRAIRAGSSLEADGILFVRVRNAGRRG